MSEKFDDIINKYAEINNTEENSGYEPVFSILEDKGTTIPPPSSFIPPSTTEGQLVLPTFPF